MARKWRENGAKMARKWRENAFHDTHNVCATFSEFSTVLNSISLFSHEFGKQRTSDTKYQCECIFVNEIDYHMIDSRRFRAVFAPFSRRFRAIFASFSRHFCMRVKSQLNGVIVSGSLFNILLFGNYICAVIIQWINWTLLIAILVLSEFFLASFHPKLW